MASEDFLIRLSVVVKKFELIANEFLSVICQFLNVGIQGYILVDDIQTVLSNLLRKLRKEGKISNTTIAGNKSTWALVNGYNLQALTRFYTRFLLAIDDARLT